MQLITVVSMSTFNSTVETSVENASDEKQYYNASQN